MSKVPCLPFILCMFGLAHFWSFGVVKEQDLIVRWTFDEGNGSVTNDVTGGGLGYCLVQMPSGGWKVTKQQCPNLASICKRGMLMLGHRPMIKLRRLGSFHTFYGSKPMVNLMHTLNYCPKKNTVNPRISFRLNRMGGV